MSDESTGASAPSESTSTESTNSPESTSTNPMGQMADSIAKKYKVKIDGADSEVDEHELISNYQLRKASDKRFQEGMQARKQAEEFVRLLKTDPQKVLSHPTIGMDLKAFAEDYLIKQIEQDMMTPEQKQMKEYQEKLSRYEEAEKKQKQEQEQQQQTALQQKYADDYNKQIVGALDSSGLPKTEFTVQRMIYYMYKGLESGYDLSAADVTDLVRRDYINDTKALYSGLDEEALFKILGDDVAGKIRKADLRKFKTSNPNALKFNSPGAGTTPKEKTKVLTKDEWREMIKQRSEE